MTEKDTIYMRYWGNGAEALRPTCGYVAVNKEDIPLLAAYLLPTPTGVAFLGSIVSSPFPSKEERRNSLKSMVQYLSEKAKEMGCMRIITTPTVDSLTRLFVSEGFNTYPRKADYLWKDL